MKTKLVPILGVSLIALSFAPTWTGAAEPEQAYFEATISNADVWMSGPHVLVTAGRTADVRLSPSGVQGKKLGLQFVVDAPVGSNMSATVTGLVNGEAVVSGPLRFTRDEGTSITLEGGGYHWQVHAERWSEELQRRSRRTP